MGVSRLAWAGKAAARWGIALGLLVSITAQAGQEVDFKEAGRTRIDIAASTPTLSPPLITAHYAVGSPDDLDLYSDEIEPNTALKPKWSELPSINSAGKSDPFIALRPGFESKSRAAFVASLGAGEVAGWSDNSRSPAAATPDASQPLIVYGDGATPTLPLDLALNSLTPRPSDSKLRIGAAVALKPGAPTQIVRIGMSDAKPNYAVLIDPKDSARQMRCLAEAIYFEARSEPEAGQAAVAQVVLNRVRSGIFPTDVCGVVYQDANHPFACQFTFACEGKSLRIEEPGAWAIATRIAKEVVAGTNYDPKLIGAVNYHATYVYPFWAPSLRRVDKIGMHIFYAMRPGLYWAPGALNGRGDLPPLQAQASAAPPSSAH